MQFVNGGGGDGVRTADGVILELKKKKKKRKEKNVSRRRVKDKLYKYINKTLCSRDNVGADAARSTDISTEHQAEAPAAIICSFRLSAALTFR